VGKHSVDISVLGMDLAARHSGLCYIPKEWDGTQGGLICREIGYNLKGKLDERTKIQIMLNVAKTALAMVHEFKPDRVVVEDYAFSRQSSSTTMQAEIGGVVRSQIYLSTNITVEPLSVTGARKFLTGGLRGKRSADASRGIRCLGAKEQVKKFLANRGIVFDTEDIMDAFVVAYYRYCKLNGILCSFRPIAEHEQTKEVRRGG